VVIVILPLSATLGHQGPQSLVRSQLAVRLAPVLRRYHRGSDGPCALYYLGCVPDGNESIQSQLALATTTLGWPSGSFVLLPAGANAVAEAITPALDRLRWLFAGSLDIMVFSLEPGVAAALGNRLEPREDRAPLLHLWSSDQDLSALLRDSERELIAGQPPSVRPSRAGLMPRYPVVFCHGMLAFTSLRMQLPDDLNCLSPLRPFLKERGFRALFPQVAPTSGVVARAHQLCDQISQWTREPVNLIAHSMGGLDARYAITHLGLGEQVRSLTTVATPHHGTCLVDWFLTNYRQRVPLLLAMEALGINIDGFKDCRPSACVQFNASTPDAPGVRYFSYGGAVPVAHVTPVLRRAWNLLNAAEGANDGMVSTASARWGEYLGTVHADHFAQTPDMAFVRPGENFDSLAFYFRLLEDLARRGF
jgi:triacylglycerol lipase